LVLVVLTKPYKPNKTKPNKTKQNKWFLIGLIWAGQDSTGQYWGGAAQDRTTKGLKNGSVLKKHHRCFLAVPFFSRL
jgi:hypothetical protein